MHRRYLPVALSVLTLMVAAAALDCDPMCQHGTCVANHGNKSCQCDPNWYGDNCSRFICDIDNTLCGNGICVINPKNQSQFLCACPTGYTGDSCQYTMLPGSACQPNTCNGGTCYIKATNQNSTVCVNCLAGSYGPLCQYMGNDPCVANNYCNGHGVCSYDAAGLRQCNCSSDYSSPLASCSIPKIKYCLNSPCANGATCDLAASIRAGVVVCICTANYTGPNCTVPFNVCEGRCLSGSTCYPTEGYNYFKCICPPLFTGERCETPVDPCVGITCANGGTCVRNASSPSLWSCRCPRGFGGVVCSAITQCNVNPCQHGGTCVPTAAGGYVCSCDRGYTGVNCTSELNLCALTQPCQHGGTCHSDDIGEFSCDCPVGYTGATCDERDYCAGVTCVNGSTCVSMHDTYVCACPQAIGDPSVCATPNYCPGSPCDLGGTCAGSNVTGLCPDGVSRSNCSSSVPSCGTCENGGTCANIGGVASCVCAAGFTGRHCESAKSLSQCPSSCLNTANNGVCDLECFTSVCNYGNEAKCRHPWSVCKNSNQCPQKFRNGHCDVQCNTKGCLYDGYDCVPSIDTWCSEDLQEKCQHLEGDGVCQPECYTSNCPYDQKDCQAKSNLVSGYLVMVIFGAQPFLNTSKLQFLSSLANVIRSQPFVVSKQLTSIDQLAKDGYPVSILPTNSTYNSTNLFYNLTLQLDNQFCQSPCPESAADAANILQAYLATDGYMIAAYTVLSVRSASDTSPPPSPGSLNSNAIAGAVVGVLVVMVMVAVVALVLGKRDRIRAKLWRPQSPGDVSDHTSPEDRRRSTTGTIASINGSRADSEEFFIKGTKLARLDSNSITLSTVTVTTMADSASVNGASNSKPERKWTCLHYEALRNPKLVQELVTNHRHHTKSPDVNAKGPGGYTPLMLAVMSKRIEMGGGACGTSSRSNSESSGDHDSSILLNGIHYKKAVVESHSNCSSDVSGGVLPNFDPMDCTVGVLLGTPGVDVNSCNDYGQTALHLAAACSRGDYIQQLLKGGANPNVQDKEGRTPLQVAIGACAEGTFTILVNHPSTDINLASEGLITPLMLAVKHLNLLMIRSLLRRNAEITAVDSEGRTAIHWAAVINNLDALKMLMRQGPETLKDAQDNKGQTALFLACREGAVDCVRHLLDCFANTTLLDNLDRSPLQIAKDKLHHDIVDMLKQATHGPYSQFSVMHAQKGFQPYVQELHFPPPRCHQVVTTPPSTVATHMDTGDLHHHMAGDPREQNPYTCLPRPRSNTVANGYQDCRVGVSHQMGGVFANGVHPSTLREDVPAHKVLTKVKSSVSAYNPWTTYHNLGIDPTTLQQHTPPTTTPTTTSTSMAPLPQSLGSYQLPTQMTGCVDTYVDGLDLDGIADLLPSSDIADDFQAAYINSAMPTMTNTKPLQHLPYDGASEYSPPQGSCSNSSPSYPSPPNSTGLVPSVTGGHGDTPSPESHDYKKSSPYMETHYVIEPVYHGDCRLGNIHNPFPYQLPSHAAESAV